MTSVKDKVNKASGLLAGIFVAFILVSYLFNLQVFVNLSSFLLMFLVGPLFLVWFGTRKNGCGSCNQDYSCGDTKRASEKTTDKSRPKL